MIGCIIQARMGSTRLPGKVMKKLDGKHTVLYYVLQQIENSRLVDKVVIATTTLKEDDAIVNFAKEMDVDYFRGDSQDVLDRYYQCARQYSFPVVVRITSDAPLVDPEITDQVIKEFVDSEYDYVCNTQPRTFPQGTETEVFSFSALEKIWSKAKLPSEREHVTPYFYTHPEEFDIFNVKNSQDTSHLRWCIDKENDLQVVKTLVQNISKRPILSGDIIEFIRDKPEILEKNRDNTINEGYFKSLEEDRKFLKKQ